MRRSSSANRNPSAGCRGHVAAYRSDAGATPAPRQRTSCHGSGGWTDNHRNSNRRSGPSGAESEPLRRNRPFVAKIAFETRGTASKVCLGRPTPDGKELDERRRSRRSPTPKPANPQRKCRHRPSNFQHYKRLTAGGPLCCGFQVSRGVAEEVECTGVHARMDEIWMKCGSEPLRRFVGTVRQELLDHVIVPNERHLRQLVGSFVTCYNADRRRLGVSSDSPCDRPVEQSPGARSNVISLSRVGGLGHRYE